MRNKKKSIKLSNKSKNLIRKYSLIYSVGLILLLLIFASLVFQLLKPLESYQSFFENDLVPSIQESDQLSAATSNTFDLMFNDIKHRALLLVSSLFLLILLISFLCSLKEHKFIQASSSNSFNKHSFFYKSLLVLGLTVLFIILAVLILSLSSPFLILVSLLLFILFYFILIKIIFLKQHLVLPLKKLFLVELVISLIQFVSLIIFVNLYIFLVNVLSFSIVLSSSFFLIGLIGLIYLQDVIHNYFLLLYLRKKGVKVE